MPHAPQRLREQSAQSPLGQPPAPWAAGARQPGLVRAVPRGGGPRAVPCVLWVGVPGSSRACEFVRDRGCGRRARARGPDVTRAATAAPRPPTATREETAAPPRLEGRNRPAAAMQEQPRGPNDRGGPAGALSQQGESGGRRGPLGPPPPRPNLSSFISDRPRVCSPSGRKQAAWAQSRGTHAHVRARVRSAHRRSLARSRRSGRAIALRPHAGWWV